MDGDTFVDAETDLEGRIKTIIAEQMVMAEAGWRTWMETKMAEMLNEMKAEFRREQNKVYRMMNTNLEECNKQKKYLDGWMA